jgi:radical SAM superfamily enzyme YgiQ (UPF0313 family)
MNENLEVYTTTGRQPIAHLDQLPMINRSLVDYEKYSQFIGQSMVKDCITLQGTRGCPYKCAFCHKVWPKKHYVRSAGNLFEEINHYYKMGIKRFVFVDDIFNLNVENSTRFFRLLIKNGLKVQLLFPNGLRGDLLTKEYIDLMVEAGTIDISFALDTASPRLQKLIGKNLNIEKFTENVRYTCEKHPALILEFQVIWGFPTETEEEALMSLDFIKNMKWLDFPYIHALKIFLNTEMEKLAIQNGVSPEDIKKSADLAYDDLPATLPFDKKFARKYKAKFLSEYFLAKDRLLAVLPNQMKLFTENELMQKYNSYLPGKFGSITDLLEVAGISEDELDSDGCIPGDTYSVPGLNEKIRSAVPPLEPAKDAFKVLLLDLSLYFSNQGDVLYNVVEQPLGLLYLMSYLIQQKGNKIKGKIAKSRIDFDSYEDLKILVEEFKPDVIGVRSLSFFRNFFHEGIRMIRQWGIDVPVIAGGPYATSEYLSLLQDQNINAAVLGEGEITFSELLDKIMENNGKMPEDEVLKKIDGIAFIPGKNADRKETPRIIKSETAGKLSKQREKQILERLSIDLEDEV